MKFRTEVDFKESGKKISPDDQIFSIGSCFAAEMHSQFTAAQLQSLHNPFGTIFNPYSINVALKRIHDAQFYTEEDLISFSDQFISLDHHTAFDSAYAHKTLEKINTKIEEANQFLRNTDWVIITYGTSFIHEFEPKNRIVANCHKIPAKFFKKRLLSHLELTDSVYESIQLLKDICKPEVKILFTVSPVRHTKEGMAENTLSKSKLISAVHEIVEDFEFCDYLPVYEIMMDDLRDYRFYKDDLIHPNSQAVNYIFEKFGNAYFSDEAMNFVEENFRIRQALNHKTDNENDPKYQDFLEKIRQRIDAQQQKVKHPIFK